MKEQTTDFKVIYPLQALIQPYSFLEEYQGRYYATFLLKIDEEKGIEKRVAFEIEPNQARKLQEYIDDEKKNDVGPSRLLWSESYLKAIVSKAKRILLVTFDFEGNLLEEKYLDKFDISKLDFEIV